MPAKTHGRSNSFEYRCWHAMWTRCVNHNAKNFPHYGGRGISVCPRWKSFSNFLADIGEAPTQKHSLDRIANDGNYEPGNVRWATRLVQARNARTTRRVFFDGRDWAVNDLAEKVGLNHYTLRRRLDAGVSVAEAINYKPYAKSGDVARNKTHCKRGHAFTPEDFVRTTGKRRCKACANALKRAAYAKRQAIALMEEQQ